MKYTYSNFFERSFSVECAKQSRIAFSLLYRFVSENSLRNRRTKTKGPGLERLDLLHLHFFPFAQRLKKGAIRKEKGRENLMIFKVKC